LAISSDERANKRIDASHHQTDDQGDYNPDPEPTEGKPIIVVTLQSLCADQDQPIKNHQVEEV